MTSTPPTGSKIAIGTISLAMCSAIDANALATPFAKFVSAVTFRTSMSK
eukprot:CAMPEP_0172686238 /NCGR_PEP_ID=MMETSP1074-20121228/20802_1 /TAXON_ID=2916 /ORGANISM="Ceratium fusus, Strain PA161109" /LENGTH=48 /DNA_ID= /DNA_START= /DNA_END= /DNA_ORIENTATION=